MTGKDALKAWTKAKPLLLNNTGVSEILRRLPEKELEFVDVAALKKVVAELDDKTSEKKIAAEKKAVAALKAIQESITKFVKHVETDRDAVVALLKEIGVAAQTYHKTVEPVKGAKLSVKMVSAFDCSAQVKKADTITSRGQDQSAVKKKHLDDFRASYDTMGRRRDLMIEMMKDMVEAKPKRTPEEFKTDFTATWKEFGEEMAKLKPIWDKIEKY